MAAKEMISLRVWRQDLEAWKQAARMEGVDRSTWMNRVLNSATSRLPRAGVVSVAEESESSNEPAKPIPQ